MSVGAKRYFLFPLVSSLSLFSLTRVMLHTHTLSLLLSFPSERGCFEEKKKKKTLVR